MADKLETFLNAFHWMQIFEFWFDFHWIFPSGRTVIRQYCTAVGWVPNRRRAIIWTNVDITLSQCMLMNIFQILSIEYFIKTVLVGVKKDEKICYLSELNKKQRCNGHSICKPFNDIIDISLCGSDSSLASFECMYILLEVTPAQLPFVSDNRTAFE